VRRICWQDVGVNWSVQCGVVIPCLNEAAVIGDLVRAVRRHVSTVVVVDDGSQDETGRLAVAAGATVLRHARPQGKGAALGTGLRALRELGLAWAVVMDGDGQHAAGDIPAFLQQAQREGECLIVGNRAPHAERMPWLRRVANRWMSAWLSQLTGTLLPDSQCGFRMLPLAAWETLAIRTTHFEIESEMLTAFLDAGYAVRFVPIQVIYGNERTKISLVKDSVRWCRWWLRTKRRRPVQPERAGHNPGLSRLRSLETAAVSAKLTASAGMRD
jgi:glycosyltransferase involved in cell wall biosynthesis